MRLVAVLALASSLLLAGCAMTPTAAPSALQGMSLQGVVHGGQQPVVGARVYLLAAGAGAPGTASVSLLTQGVASDSIGTYVTTGNDGGFNITGAYTCTQNQQVYLYAAGGNPVGGINTGASVLAILGSCPASGSFAAAVPYVTVNEISTVAAAYAFAGFATDATHVSSSGTALGLTGLANAFASAANLADLGSGTALAKTPAGNGVVPQATIVSLANVLAACINSTSSPSTSVPCGILFANATDNGLSTGTVPTETATSAISIAHNPAANVANLYPLQTAASPFQTGLASAPSDWTLAVTYSGGGMNIPTGLAVDGSGNIWIANAGGGAVTKLSNLGAVLSGANGYTNSNLKNSDNIAIDPTGNAWLAGAANISGSANSVTEISPAGAFLSGATGYPMAAGSAAVAIDGNGNAWMPGSSNSGTLIEMSPSGVVLNGSGYKVFGSGGSQFLGVAVDASGRVLSAGVTFGVGVTVIAAPTPSTSYQAAELGIVGGLAVDHAGNIWAGAVDNGDVVKFSSTGVVSPGFFGGYSSNNAGSATGIAIDGAGSLWVEHQGSTLAISKLSNAGVFAYSITHDMPGNTGFAPNELAIDGSGNLWNANLSKNTVTEFVGTAIPVVTPLSVGVKTNTLGSRP